MPAPGLRVAGSVVFLFFTTYGWICCLPILHCMRKRDCASSWSMCGWICWLPFFHYIWLDLSTSYFALQVEEGICQLLAYVWLDLLASYSSLLMAGFVGFLFCTAGGRGTVPAPGLRVAGSVGFLFFNTYGWICRLPILHCRWKRDCASSWPMCGWICRLPFLHHIWLDLLASFSAPHMAGSVGFLFFTTYGWFCWLPVLHCRWKRDCASSWPTCGWIESTQSLAGMQCTSAKRPSFRTRSGR